MWIEYHGMMRYDWMDRWMEARNEDRDSQSQMASLNMCPPDSYSIWTSASSFFEQNYRARYLLYLLHPPPQKRKEQNTRSRRVKRQ
jgi:hypothetical protein